jgi:hypothetical protein
MDIYDPSIAIGEGVEDTLLVAYIVDNGIDPPMPQVGTRPLSGGFFAFHVIPIWATFEAYANPVIWTDSVEWNAWYAHLTCEGVVDYKAKNINICHWRSLDYGDTWSDGTLVLGGSDTFTWANPDGCFGTPGNLNFIACFNYSLDRLYSVQSVTDGLSWDLTVMVSHFLTPPSHSVEPEIAAAIFDPHVMICCTIYSDYYSSDCVGQVYSKDSGETFGKLYTLEGSTASNEFAPCLTANEGGGSWHLAYTSQNKVMYSRRPQDLSEYWQAQPDRVDDEGDASASHPVKGIASHWDYDGAFIAWPDFRDGTPDYDVYMDYCGNSEGIYIPTDWPTIQGAIDKVMPGASIYVEPGTYYENIDFNGKTLGLTSTDGADYTVIDGMQNGSVVTIEGIDTIFSVVTGFTITNGSSVGGGGFRLVDGLPVILNNHIVGNDAIMGGGILCLHAFAIVVNNTIYGNTAGGYGGGIYADTQDPIEIVNTIIWNNTAGTGDSILYVDAEPIALYCDVEGGWPGEGTIDADPLFVDAAAGDFHLTYQTPCRDAGTDDYWIVPFYDHESDPRMDGDGIYDIGADEFFKHFYYKGDAVPAATVMGRLVDVPGTNPIGVWFGNGVFDPPIPTQWGDFYIMPPFIFVGPLGAIPTDGVMDLPGELPLDPPAPYDVPIQALVGDGFTNLLLMRVR